MVSFLSGLGAVAGGVAKGLQAGKNNYMQRQLFDQSQGALDTAGQALFADPSLNMLARDPSAPGALGPMAARSSGGAPAIPPNNDVAAYIQTAATQRGIDPQVALKVFTQESGLRPDAVGDGRSSFGPTQLHYGGVAAGGNSVPGLGDEFTKTTGLDARDPSTWKQQIDFSLDHVAKGGWGPWHAAKNIGIQPMQGIGGPQQMAQAAQGGGAPQPQGQPQQGGFSPMLQRAIGLINRANPNASPTQKMLALEKMAPFLKQEDQLQIAQMKMDLQGQMAQMRYDMARDLEAGRNQRANTAEEGRTARASNAEEGRNRRFDEGLKFKQAHEDALVKYRDTSEARRSKKADEDLALAKEKEERLRQQAINAKNVQDQKLYMAAHAQAQRESNAKEVNAINAARALAALEMTGSANKPAAKEAVQGIMPSIRKGATVNAPPIAGARAAAPSQSEEAPPADQLPPEAVKRILSLKPGEQLQGPNNSLWENQNGKPVKVQ